MSAIWDMRKKSVGLLGNMQGDKRPIAFVEDTAVPPENLADYIAEFRAALDARGLTYGMFGHVDAGVLHVRPAIDMKDPAQEGLIRDVTEDVVRITKKYGGLLWGEHGKGVRSEFSPRFFGPLYPALQSIKAAFDPRNQLNPGKIAAPEDGELLRIDGLTTRGQLDRTIPPPVRAAYDEALHCNGNGACFTWDPDEAMCPSYKATRDRRHSPKGRASLTREWLRQLAALGFDPAAEAASLRQRPGWRTYAERLRNTRARRRGEPDFSHAVKDAMDGCLACKSCTGQCPIKVDVPTFRAKFLELYYSRYLRPRRDYLVGSLETMLPAVGKTRGAYNFWLDSPPGRATMRALGLVHTPKFSRLSMRRELAARGIADATPQALSALSAEERARSVVLVQDAFTSWYETHVVLAVLDLMRAIGFRPFVAPFRPNGKPLARAWFPRRLHPRRHAERAHAACPGGNRGGACRRGYVHDADLSLGIRDAAGSRPAAARAAPAGMAGPAPGRDPASAPVRRRIFPVAALLGAFPRGLQSARLAGGVRGSGRKLARAALRLLRHGRDLWP